MANRYGAGSLMILPVINYSMFHVSGSICICYFLNYKHDVLSFICCNLKYHSSTLLSCLYSMCSSPLKMYLFCWYLLTQLYCRFLMSSNIIWLMINFLLFALKVVQNIFSRPSIFDGAFPPYMLEDLLSLKPPGLWVNVEVTSA